MNPRVTERVLRYGLMVRPSGSFARMRVQRIEERLPAIKGGKTTESYSGRGETPEKSAWKSPIVVKTRHFFLELEGTSTWQRRINGAN